VTVCPETDGLTSTVRLVEVRIDVPVLISWVTCGLAPPSSVKLRVADLEPTAVAVNLPTSVQVPPGLIAPAQLFS
jgi:hypothetical protein